MGVGRGGSRGGGCGGRGSVPIDRPRMPTSPLTHTPTSPFTAGKYIQSFGKKGKNGGGNLAGPSAVAPGEEGSIFVADK